MLVNDDIVIKTKKWDTVVRNLNNKFSDHIYLAYPNDLNKGKNLCTFPILSKKTCNKLVRPFPLEYNGAFIDLHIFDIFKRLEKVNMNRIIYLENIIFEHLHFRTGKSSLDNTYIKRNRFEDDNTFHNMTSFRKFQMKSIIDNNNNSKINLNDYVVRKKLFFLNKIALIFRYAFDNNLPFRWGLFLTFYFTIRNIYKFMFNKSTNF